METDTSPTVEKPEFKFRWFQYRLRPLFLLTLLVAIGMSYVAVTIRGQRRQKVAATAIQKAEGTVEPEPTWLGRLLRDDSLVNLTAVDLSRKSTTDAGLAHLQGLSQLQGLDLRDTKVTDEGVQKLQQALPNGKIM